MMTAEVDLPEPDESDGSAERLRRRIAAEFEEWPGELAWQYFVARVAEPEDDLVAEWDRQVELYEKASKRARVEWAEASWELERRLATSSYQDVSRSVEQEAKQWLPATAARDEFSARYPDLNWVEARVRRDAARQAAEARDYRVWAEAVWPEAKRARDREAALARVEDSRDAVAARFRREWGMELPESVFRFQAFLYSLPSAGHDALYALELMPFGGGVGLPWDTPLRQVRGILESRWRRLHNRVARTDWPDSGLIAKRHRLRLLREAIMAFETAEYPQEGEDYFDASKDPELFEGRPEGVETLDETGVRGFVSPQGDRDTGIASDGNPGRGAVDEGLPGAGTRQPGRDRRGTP